MGNSERGRLRRSFGLLAACCLVSAFCLLPCALTSARSSGEPTTTGAAAVWFWLQKLATTASLMHTTAHPDDEHGGMLTLASRGWGARVSLLTLTRGEAGDNALGPQLFDALGLIRTEELAVADRYYGVDQQYFTSVIDYGFSKRLEEAFDKWGRENVLRDMVRIIRTERPLVIVSRFQGNPRDGHGNHQTAGLLTQQAFEAAANPAMFPDQISEGLRPWRSEAALHRRDARGRGLDGSREHGPVQSLARRLVREHRPRGSQLPAFAEQRTARPRGGVDLRLLQTHGFGWEGAESRSATSSTASTRRSRRSSRCSGGRSRTEWRHGSSASTWRCATRCECLTRVTPRPSLRFWRSASRLPGRVPISLLVTPMLARYSDARWRSSRTRSPRHWGWSSPRSRNPRIRRSRPDLPRRSHRRR